MSKQEVDASEITKQVDFFPHTGIGIERVADNPGAYIAYKLTYRCKDCGKEWTKLSTEEVDIPKSYVEDEEEKTEYDGEKEAEEAREEEYAREEPR